MPIYEYECTKCGHYLEALQKISDKPLRECPECGKHSLKRLVSAPMFRLSGSGWYETDFKSESEKKRNLADRGDKDAPAESKGESKPEAPATEAKAEAKPDTSASEPKTTSRRTMVTKPSAKAAPKTGAASRARKPVARKAAARRGRR